MPGLGESKPLELKDHMLGLLGNHEACFIFRELFLRLLPDQVELALANMPVQDFSELAREADKFLSAACGFSTATPFTASIEPVNAIASRSVALGQGATGLCFYHAQGTG